MEHAFAEDRSEFLTIQGRGTSPGLACGPLLRNSAAVPAEAMHGSILVAERAVPDDVGRIMACAGTITLGGSLLSHVSLLSRELGKPSISLGGADPARLVALGGRGLLDVTELAESVATIVEEGDIVLLDGDRGTLRIPGARCADARRNLRGIYGLLLEFARDPGSAALAHAIRDAARDPRGPELPFLLEAGLVHRLVPAGRPARILLESLQAACAGSGLLEPRLELLCARLLAFAAGRHDRALETLRSTVDPHEIERVVTGFEAILARARALLLDVGASPAGLEALAGDVTAEARERRAALAQRLRGEIADALVLGDEKLAARAASLYVLVRRARSVGMEHEALRALEARLERPEDRREDATTPLVVPLVGSRLRSPAVVGGKAAGLFELRPLLPAGCRIPRGFVVTSAAYRLHVRGEIGEHLRTCLGAGQNEADVSRRARAALLAGEIPEPVVRAVASSLEGLLAHRLAVRASSTIEDGPAGSLAGQFDTFLGVQGLPELLNRIRWTWASLWNARAIRALSAAGLSPLDESQAVIVQEMIETRAAGVLVSRDAARGADTILVNAAWGLGEGISLGAIPGDLFWVRRSTGELLATEPGTGATQIVLDPKGTGTVESLLPPDRAGRVCLNGGELARLAELARALAGAPRMVRDVEFGFAEDDALVVFQIRPVSGPGGASPAAL